MANTTATKFAMEWRNDLTEDQVPLGILDVEVGDIVTLKLNELIGGGTDIDILQLTELDGFKSYKLRWVRKGWVLTEVYIPSQDEDEGEFD